MTTQERLQNLVELAKAAGRYVEQGGQRKSDYGKEAYVHLKAHYDTFCEWRHDEPDILHAMTIDERDAGHTQHDLDTLHDGMMRLANDNTE